MKILIVEDEEPIALEIRDMLELMGYPVTAIADSYESALAAIENKLPDLVLVDIELKGHLTGIDLGRRLGQMGINHMYLTGVQDASTFVKARETAPLRNIPKPVSAISLRNALDIDSVERVPLSTTVIRMFPSGDKKRRIDLNEIIYIKAGGSYCDVFLTGDQGKITLSMNLKNCLKKLDWPNIIRVGRSNAVNIHHVKTQMGNRLEMSNTEWVDIEPKFKSIVEKRIQSI